MERGVYGGIIYMPLPDSAGRAKILQVCAGIKCWWSGGVVVSGRWRVGPETPQITCPCPTPPAGPRFCRCEVCVGVACWRVMGWRLVE